MADKLRFFPLDVTYKVQSGKAVICIFGKTPDGKQVCVIDENFEPYFYVIPKNIEGIQEKLEKISVERNGEVSYVTKTELVKKKFLSKEINAIKVYTKLPRDVPIIREIVKEWEILEHINEYDILFARRYMVDKGIVPLTLVEAECEGVKLKLRVPAFRANKINPSGDETLKKLRILAFDIETYNPTKTILPEKNPIIMLALYGTDFKKVLTWKRFKTASKEIEFVENEAKLIERFKDCLEEYKPDILTGYFSDEFDLPYIKARADIHKIKLDIGLDYSELKLKNMNSKISGIIHLDIFKFIKKIIRDTLDTEYYNLNAVASELLGEKKQDVDLDELADVWDNKAEELEKFCSYNLQDSLLVFRLCERVIPNIVELVKITGLAAYDLNRMGFSQLVEGYLLKQAAYFNEIAQNKPNNREIEKRRMQTYKGAFVYEPKPGLYNNIVVFDYKSLYPTIISSHNISPGTLNCECCEGQAELIEEKYWFCKKVKGFIPTLIEELIARRMRIKDIIKDKQDVFLSARENSLKLLANSFYGYLGFFGARWYSIECARAVTAWGRAYITKVIDKAEKAGFKVLYSDTDSVFLSLENKTKKDAEKFSEGINAELPGLMEMEYEGFYPRGIFVSAKEGPYGAKKKYALLSEEGILKIKGFEAVRRNWSIIAKECQENVLNIILKENDTAKALAYVKEIVEKLKDKLIPIEKVIIQTRLQKEMKTYDSVGPHVEIARKMKEQGSEIGVGSVMRYVITRGVGRIRDRAKLPEDIKQQDYDADYYIKNQVIPAVEKIFEVLGHSREELLRSKEQKKLAEF